MDNFDEFESDDDYVIDDSDDHGGGCDCDDCRFEDALMECGRLPKEMGGGCTKAGSEDCDFGCPFRDEMYGEDDEDDAD